MGFGGVDLGGDNPDFAYEIFKSRTGGTPQEFVVYSVLESRGYVEGSDFRFVSENRGGISRFGNSKIHFLLDGLKIAIRVQGEFWSTEAKSAHIFDILQKLQWQARQYFVCDMIHQEVDAKGFQVVDLALNYEETPTAKAVLGG